MPTEDEPPTGADREGTANAVEAGLASEQVRLSELVSTLRNVLRRTGTGADVTADDYAAVRPILAELDYVYLDFPDTPAPTRSFLGRVLLSALDYEGRLRRVQLMRERLAKSANSRS